MASDKRGTQIDSKLPDLFLKAEALAAEARAEHERDAAVRRQEEIESHRRRELERQIKRLRRNAVQWHRTQRIRAYIQAVAARLKAEGSIPPESDTAKWLAWARRYADSIDPTYRPISLAPKEFWEQTARGSGALSPGKWSAVWHIATVLNVEMEAELRHHMLGGMLRPRKTSPT